MPVPHSRQRFQSDGPELSAPWAAYFLTHQAIRGSGRNGTFPATWPGSAHSEDTEVRCVYSGKESRRGLVFS